MFSYNPNIYTSNFDKRCVNAAINHAKEEYPNESCGAIIEGHYIRFENKAEDTLNDFIIDDDNFSTEYMNNNVECLIHSHNDSAEASLLDQQQQIKLDIPSMIINLRNRSLMDCIVFGCKEHAPLYDRPFFWGFFDCVSLVSDYILDEFNFKIEFPVHEFGFWGKGEHPFEDYLDGEHPFIEVPIKDIKKHDILLYNIDGSRYINHIAVVTSDNGEVLHHMIYNVSGTYPINFNRRYLRKVMRFKEQN